MPLPPKIHNVLSFDLSARTGWAAGLPNEVPVFGTHPVGMEDDGRSYLALEKLALRLITELKPTAIAIEAPIMKQGGTTFHTQIRLHGYAAIIKKIAAQIRAPLVEANIATVRKTFIGRAPRAKEAKALIVAECLRCGLSVPDHNAADAVAVWFWAQKVKWASGHNGVRIDRQSGLFSSNG